MTHIVRYENLAGETKVGLRHGNLVRQLPVGSMAELLSGDLRRVRDQAASPGPPEEPARLLPPVDRDTEVWAAGVTYQRSREARIEESTQASVYDLVYDADRPELFLKSPAWRVVTDGDPVRLRADSPNDIPEPELAAVLTASGEIAGWTVCDDLTARGIEGQNPLYLPQAKIWDASCSLAPGIRPAWEVDIADGWEITMSIRRGGRLAFAGSTSTDALRRTVPDLAGWLFRETSFPNGAVLSTGTGIVPPLDFTLRHGDVITIDIDGIGTLVNTVHKGETV